MADTNITGNYALTRIYGLLAYGDDKEIREALEIISTYPYTDYFIVEVRTDVSEAVTKIKNLKDTRKAIVNQLLQGIDTGRVAHNTATSSRYVRAVRTELVDAIRSYFSEIVTLEDYKTIEQTNARYRTRNKDKFRKGPEGTVEGAEYTTTDIKGTEEYPVNERRLKQDNVYHDKLKKEFKHLYEEVPQSKDKKGISH